MAFDKPLVYTDDDIWNEFNERYSLGISFQEGADIGELQLGIKRLLEAPIRHEEEDYSWASDEVVLAGMLRGILV